MAKILPLIHNATTSESLAYALYRGAKKPRDFLVGWYARTLAHRDVKLFWRSSCQHSDELANYRRSVARGETLPRTRRSCVGSASGASMLIDGRLAMVVEVNQYRLMIF